MGLRHINPDEVPVEFGLELTAKRGKVLSDLAEAGGIASNKVDWPGSALAVRPPGVRRIVTTRNVPPVQSAAKRPRRDSGHLPWRWQFSVAAMLIVAFAVLTVFMMYWANASDTVWKNRVFVFSSVEAVVFTAVGWVFGREVHRAEAESAHKDAEDAREDAKEKSELADRKARESADERAKGMRLAGAVETFAAGPADRKDQTRDVGFRAESAGSSSQVAFLQDLARRLYG
jgi:hypothetical protein